MDVVMDEPFERWSTHLASTVTVDVCGRQLTLRQQPSSDQLGQSVWDVARVMAKFFERGFMSKEIKNHCRFVEIGAGLGLLGMTVAMLGGNVVLTDIAEIVPYLLANIEANQHVIQPPNHNRSPSIEVRELDWTNPASAHDLSPPVDVVLGTDVVYYPELVEPLARTLVALAGDQTQIIIVNERRSPKVHEQFLRAMQTDFKYQRLDLDGVRDAFNVDVFEGFIFRKRRRATATV